LPILLRSAQEFAPPDSSVAGGESGIRIERIARDHGIRQCAGSGRHDDLRYAMENEQAFPISRTTSQARGAQQQRIRGLQFDGPCRSARIVGCHSEGAVLGERGHEQRMSRTPIAPVIVLHALIVQAVRYQRSGCNVRDALTGRRNVVRQRDCAGHLIDCAE
jgi:hypothetical protein